MKKQIKLEDVKEISEEMFNVITKYNSRIKEFMSTIAKCGYLLQVPNIQIFSEEATNYKDDGNTQTPGITWSAYWILPLTTTNDYLTSVQSFRGGYCEEAIIFSFSNYDQRLYDGRISGCKFFEVSFSFGSYFDIVNLNDGVFIKNKHIKLEGINNNSEEVSLLNHKSLYLKLLLCLKKLNEVKEIETLFDNSQIS